MRQRKWKTVTSLLLLATLVFAGFLAVAAEYGTSDDPLVSLSYINNVLAPEISKKVDEIIAAKTASLATELDGKITAFNAELDGKLSEYASGSAESLMTDALVNQVAAKVAEKVGAQSSGSATFQLVKLTSGQTLKCSVGCEALLRIGTAACVSSGSPGLIDMTTGGDLANSSPLEKNHLYLCTVDGRGIKASSEVTLMVRGTYTIS